ncbi:hypothetical protein GPECTOR_5g82 [Gonium pectorale]|uniref:Glycosyltransferase 2-like domain-containing protein n=1 Tax=Gonium pectorale TaxID=33097 RepID=A0A150GX86_GONPE|nr:hypothetical protein GPECTOR_5g82 [Gonium pectorale]|eukprot:KXZ54429.1 hypothetical protein GPECTOR_5g82 [Gonium pectorale]
MQPHPVLAAVALLPLFFATALGGPDRYGLPFCKEMYSGIKSARSTAVTDAVQALQAIEMRLGQLQLGRPLPLSSIQKSPDVSALTAWKEGNTTKLLQLLESTGMAQHYGGSSAATMVAQKCLSNKLHPRKYAAMPYVSVLLEYFRRPAVVSRIAAVLQRNCASVGLACELVVNVDNPHEASAWAAEVANGSVVPVFSSNVHESRGYNRAARAARGRYLVIWQDDQIPPDNGQWVLDMIKIFDAHPHLGVLGMNTYRLCKHMEPTNRFHWTNWQPDPKTGVRWSFAQTVDFAPLAIRASVYRELGGLDEGISRNGECGIWGDWELCGRVWMAGWTVGYMFLDGRNGDGQPGGTHVGASGERCWGRQQFVASHVYHHRYGIDPLQGEWCDRVWLLNMHHFKLSDKPCPYGSHDTRFGNCTALSLEQEEEAKRLLATVYEGRRSRTAASWARGAVQEVPGPGGATFTVMGAGAAAAVGPGNAMAEGAGAQGQQQPAAAAVGAAAAGSAGGVEMVPKIVRDATQKNRRRLGTRRG